MCKALRTVLLLVVTAVGFPRAGAQAISESSPAVAATDQFSRLHDSLDRTAEGLLSHGLRLPPALNQSRQFDVGLPPVKPIVTGPNLQTTLLPGVRRTASMRRLELLRPLLDPILQTEGVPSQLSSMIVVESGARPDALSTKGARGLWQLMPDTARRYGLIVDSARDDRLDIAKSTRAAAQYLRELHGQFHSWPLALAAYNAGEQRVRRAIDAAKKDDFEFLSYRRLLPAETRMYVPAVLGLLESSRPEFYEAGKTKARSQQGQIVYASSSD